MNGLIPVSPQAPANPLHAFRPIEPERMHLRQLFGILLQRAKLGLGVAGLVFLMVLGAFALKTPTYSAVGTVVIDPKLAELTSTEKVQGYLPPDTGAVDTQVEILRSHALYEDVVRRLRLHDDPEFNPAQGRGILGLKPAKPPIANPDPRLISKVAGVVQDHGWVRRAGLTYVVQVGFTSTSPTKSARIANTIMSTYLDRQLDQKVSAVKLANAELGRSL